MRDTLAYLATPYTKFPGGIEAAFAAACDLTARLTQTGIIVYSPIAHSHAVAKVGKLDPFDLSIWYPHNDQLMKRCDCLIVALLPSWETSVGIKYEIDFFEREAKPIFHLHPDTLRMQRVGSLSLITYSEVRAALEERGLL